MASSAGHGTHEALRDGMGDEGTRHSFVITELRPWCICIVQGLRTHLLKCLGSNPASSNYVLCVLGQ